VIAVDENLALARAKDMVAICRGMAVRTLWEAFAKYGRPMRPEPLTFAEARMVVNAAKCLGGLKNFRPKQCYFNSQSVALSWRRRGHLFEYVEGCACDPVIQYPFEHAWLLCNGKVVDLTLRAVGIERDFHYLGVVIPLRLVRRNAVLTNRYSPVTEGPLQNEVLPA
jgi:hypothetical protein